MKPLFLTITLCFFSCFSISQNYKFGKVSEDKLKETIHSKDTSANAAILYRSYNVTYNYRNNMGFVQTVDVHERIKIYNKEGFKWATEKVRLYNKDNSTSENLYALKAYTYNLVDGKITEDKLDKSAIFTEVANKYWKFESFTMPNLKEGSVIEFIYKIDSPFFRIDNIDLQFGIPVDYQEVKVSTPEYFVYNRMLNPRAKYIPRLNDSKNNVSQPFQYLENVLSSEMKDVPALRDEPFVDNIDNYRAQLIMELALTRFPNALTESYTTSWEKVTKNIYKSSSFGAEIDKNNYYRDDIDAIIAGVNDPEEKTQKIYDFVKSKVKWNKFYGLYSDEGTRKAYKEGTGNAADINLMLISMLRYSGLKASPILVSTKNHGIPLFPTTNGFNYVICHVESNGFNALLDATDEFSTLNVLPTRAINWQGRLVREDGTSDWISLSPNFVSKEIISLTANISDDLVVQGKARNQMNNHLARRHRNDYAYVNKDEYRKELESGNGQLEVNELEIENLTNPLKPVSMTYSYKCLDRVEQIGNKLYLSPLLFLSSDKNPFIQEKRDYPIDFNHPLSNNYIINIKIPEGYEIDTLPESAKYQFNGKDGEYTYLIQENGDSVQLMVKLNLNVSFILADHYEYFRNFYTLMLDKQAEQLVLKKI